jgi:hypothetical protein
VPEYPVTVTEEHGPVPRAVALLEGFHELMISKARELLVPPFDLTVVVTGDIQASVTQRSERDFQPERLGGVVAGKTIAHVRDYSIVTVVFDATLIGDDENPLVDLRRLATITHEYGHVLLGRLRATSGTRPGPPARTQTPTEAAAILAYETADEYRCDLFANALLSALEISIDGSGPAPMHLGFIYGDGYRDELVACLDRVVHPGLADLVDDYRHRRIPLEDMYGQLLMQTDQLLKLTAHADAVAAAANQSPVLDGLRTYRGVDLYLDGAWSPLRQAIATAEVIPKLPDFAAVDRNLQRLGQGIVDMWAQLGVRGSLTYTDELHLDIRAPMR